MATAEQIRQFTDQMLPLVKGVQDTYMASYPAHMVYLCLTQMALESGYGTAKLMMDNFAPFGVKATDMDIKLGAYYEAKTSEYINGKYINTVARFRKYGSFLEAIVGWYNLMACNRYAPVRSTITLDDAFIKVRECGYATAPSYTDTLRKVYNVLSKYIKAPAVSGTFTHVVSTQNDPLNVREYPDLNAKIVGSIPKGEKIYINPDWSYVPKYNGFVYNKYIKEV